MLTVFTGVPGAGKTLLMLERIVKETKPEKGKPRRPIFIHNIPEVDYQYFHAQELKDADKWYECPEGSLIVIDEAQHVFPQRQAGVTVPEKCQQFSTHRHKGFDVFITTQDASNIDAFIRRMVGRHFHVSRILNRKVATVYEYDHYESNPTGYHEKKAAVSVSAWKYPAKLFERYKSATMHTYKARTPWKLYAIPVVAIFSVWMLYKAVTGVAGMSEDMQEATAAQLGISPDSVKASAELPGKLQFLNGNDWFQLYQPAIKGILHTAPIYAELTKPVVYPKPYCILFDDGKECRCNTQQGTLYHTTFDLCSDWAKNGFFDATREELESDRWGGRGAGTESPRAPQWSPESSYMSASSRQ